MKARHATDLRGTRILLAYTVLTCHRKSQIAIEYCYQYSIANPSHSVFWAHAGTVAKFDQAYKDIVRYLCLPGWDAPQANVLQLVTDWLNNENHGSWLLVIDNADDRDVFFKSKSEQQTEQNPRLFKHLPNSRRGSIIITTRDKRVGELICDNKSAISIPVLDQQKSEAMLQSRVPKNLWSADDAHDLLRKLDNLPLAISQAAAFISNNSISIKEYLDMLHKSKLGIVDLLSEHSIDPRRDQDRPSSVIQTWKISFDQIREQEPKAADVLSLMAVLDHQGIPKALLSREGENVIELTSALGTLQAFSLITAETGGASFEMHRLVRLSTQKWLELQGDISKWQEEALVQLVRVFPDGDYDTWATCETLSPHALIVLQYQVTAKSDQLARASLLHDMACYEYQRGQYWVAFCHCDKAHTIREKQLGATHVDTLSSARALASILIVQGKYKEAEEMHREILEKRKTILGVDHEGTLQSMSDIGWALDCHGNYEAAERLHRQVLAYRERSLGPQHLEIFASKNYLALTLENQGNYEAAEQLYRQALEGRQEMLGLQRPDTLTYMRNLAAVLERQEKYEVAEKMLRQVLEIEETTLGPHHPNTLHTLSNLASVLDDLGNYDAVEQMYRQVLEIIEEMLGPQHPNTLASLNNLAIVHERLEKHGPAEQMHRQVLEIQEKTLGAQNPDTLLSVYNLAVVLRHQSKFDEAETMLRQASKTVEDKQGLLALYTLRFVSELARLCYDQGDLSQAIELMQRAQNGFQEAFGDNHPRTRRSAEWLSRFLAEKAEEAVGESAEAGESKIATEDAVSKLTSPECSLTITTALPRRPKWSRFLTLRPKTSPSQRNNHRITQSHAV